MIKRLRKMDLLGTKDGIELMIEVRPFDDLTVLTGFYDSKLLICKYDDEGLVATKEFTISEIYTKLIPMLEDGVKMMQFKEFTVNEEDTRAIKYFLKNTDFANLIVNFTKLAMEVEANDTEDYE